MLLRLKSNTAIHVQLFRLHNFYQNHESVLHENRVLFETVRSFKIKYNYSFVTLVSLQMLHSMDAWIQTAE